MLFAGICDDIFFFRGFSSFTDVTIFRYFVAFYFSLPCVDFLCASFIAKLFLMKNISYFFFFLPFT